MYREKERQRRRSPSAGSLPKLLQQADPTPGARSLPLVSHMRIGFQDFVPSSITFPCHKRGAGRVVEQLGYKPASLWDPSMYKGRILATRLSCLSHTFVLYKHFKIKIQFNCRYKLENILPVIF